MKKTTVARIVGAVFLLILLLLLGAMKVTGPALPLILFGAAFGYEYLIVKNIKNNKDEDKN